MIAVGLYLHCTVCQPGVLYVLMLIASVATVSLQRLILSSVPGEREEDRKLLRTQVCEEEGAPSQQP